MLKLQKQTLLVIAPHPDDEVIGCGGLIKKIKDNQGKVYVLFLTVGDTKDNSKKGLSTIKERKKEIESVAKFLQFNDYYLAFSGNGNHLKLDLIGQKKIMDTIERETPVSIKKIKPTVVAFPSFQSYNQDHRICAFATHASLRLTPKNLVHSALSYEQPGEMWIPMNQRQPNFFVSLTKEELDVKIKAMRLYKSQMRPFPNNRSIKVLKTLAISRGAESNNSYAEGFNIYRIII